MPVGCCLNSINYLQVYSIPELWHVPPRFHLNWSVVIFFIFMRLFFFPHSFHFCHMYVSITSEAFYVGSASYTDHTKPLSNAWNHIRAHQSKIQYNHPSQSSRASFWSFLPSFPKTTFWKGHYWCLLPCFRPPVGSWSAQPEQCHCRGDRFNTLAWAS